MFWIILSALMVACMVFMHLEFKERQTREEELSGCHQKFYKLFMATGILLVCVASPLACINGSHSTPESEPAKQAHLKQMHKEMKHNFDALEQVIQKNTQE